MKSDMPSSPYQRNWSVFAGMLLIVTWEGSVRPCRCKQCNRWCLHKESHILPHLTHQSPGRGCKSACETIWVRNEWDGKGSCVRDERDGKGTHYLCQRWKGMEEDGLTTSRTFSPVASHSPAMLHLHSGGPIQYFDIWKVLLKGSNRLMCNRNIWDI